MAYSNFLIEVGTYVIPAKFIKYDSWQSTYETVDFDSYRDADAYLHRNALPSRKIKVEFETPYLYKKDFDELMSNIRAQFVSSVEQSALITAYIDEIGDYVTQKCYLVNINAKIEQNSPLGAIYKPIRIAWIGY